MEKEPIAQRLEQGAHNALVGGSNPPRLTIWQKYMIGLHHHYNDSWADCFKVKENERN